MGSCLTAGLCCCAGCICQQCTNGLKRLLGQQKVTKLFYFILVIIFCVPAIFIFFFLNRWDAFTNYFSKWISCPLTNDLGCIGQSVVFRISFSLLILFGLMMIIMLFRARISMVINQGCFLFKYLLVIGIVIGFLWVNDQIFNNFAQFCKYASIVYMAVQSIILIDMAYLAGIKLVKRYDQGQTQYSIILVVLSIIFQAGAVTLNVFGYILFRNQWWGHTLWINIITSILLIIMPIVQLLNFNPQGSLLSTSLISLFISYLNFIAQFSYGINGSRMGVGSLVADIVCSLFIFILTMYGSILGGTGQVKITNNTNINAAMGVVGTQQVLTVNNQGNPYINNQNTGNVISLQTKRQDLQTQQNNILKYTNSWRWVKWHFYMCLASVYLSMLLTNWISLNVTSGQIKQSMFGFWVRVVISWATFFLYIWTLIVPRICPARDFTVV